MKVLARIISSQKAVMTAVGAIAVMFGAEVGLAEHITNAVAALFGVLVSVQGFLDFKHGSPSDRTGIFSE